MSASSSTIAPIAPIAPIALIAEDEPLIMMETADLLSDLGFEVIETRTAAQALNALRARPEVRLLVTDVQMPGPMQGFELARTVHADYPQIAIIVCSGHVRPGAGDLPVPAHFIDKPLSGQVLKRAMRAINLT